MNKIKKEVFASIQRNCIEAAELSDENGSKIIDILCDKFAKLGVYKFQMWDHLNTFSSIKHANAWRLVADYTGESKTIMFFEWADEHSMFLFEDGSQIPVVLEDCYAFVFYITNTNLDYLVCFNDHDYLIACGKAEEWLLSL